MRLPLSQYQPVQERFRGPPQPVPTARTKGIHTVQGRKTPTALRPLVSLKPGYTYKEPTRMVLYGLQRRPPIPRSNRRIFGRVEHPGVIASGTLTYRDGPGGELVAQSWNAQWAATTVIALRSVRLYLWVGLYRYA